MLVSATAAGEHWNYRHRMLRGRRLKRLQRHKIYIDDPDHDHVYEGENVMIGGIIVRRVFLHATAGRHGQRTHVSTVDVRWAWQGLVSLDGFWRDKSVSW